MKTIYAVGSNLPIMTGESGFCAELYFMSKEGKAAKTKKDAKKGKIENPIDVKNIFCRIISPTNEEEMNQVMEFAKGVFNPDTEENLLKFIYNSMATEKVKTEFIDGMISIFATMGITEGVSPAMQQEAIEMQEKLENLESDYAGIEDKAKTLAENVNQLRLENQSLKQNLSKYQSAVLLSAVNAVDLEDYRRVKNVAHAQQQRQVTDHLSGDHERPRPKVDKDKHRKS